MNFSFADSMLLDFKAVRGGRSSQTFRMEPDDPLLEGFFGRLAGPLEVKAEIREHPQGLYLVRLRIDVEIEAPCRRCLTPTLQPVEERSELLFRLARAGGTERTGEEEGEGEILPLRSLFDRVDIGPAVREALFLSTEIYAVCDEACKGLCPSCGADLNADECGCAPAVLDGRWDELLDLKL